MIRDKTNRREFLKKFAALSTAPLFFAGCDSVEPLYGVEPMYGVRADPGGTLTGTVTGNGVPLKDITVRFKDTDVDTLTDEYGSYRFINIGSGIFIISASGDRYATQEKETEIFINQVTTLDFELVEKAETFTGEKDEK